MHFRKMPRRKRHPRFAALLASLGFAVSLHTGAVADEEATAPDGTAAPHPARFGNHVVVVVHFGAEWAVA